MDRTISDDGKFLMKLFKEAGVIDDAIAAAGILWNFAARAPVRFPVAVAFVSLWPAGVSCAHE
jgi:hypothetical protein